MEIIWAILFVASADMTAAAVIEVEKASGDAA
jgi:hypothetical protein